MNCDDYPDLLWSYYILFAYSCGLGCLKNYLLCFFAGGFQELVPYEAGHLDWSRGHCSSEGLPEREEVFAPGPRCAMVYPLSIFIHLCPPFMAILLRKVVIYMLWWTQCARAREGLKDVERPLSTASKPETRHEWHGWALLSGCTGIYMTWNPAFFTWNQHHIQDQENNIKNYLTSSDPHRDKLFCRSFWHLIWKYIYGIYFLTFASGILSDILFWHPIWHPFWHIFWHSLWHGHWDLELAVEVWQCPLRPGSSHWSPELAVAIRGQISNKEGRNEGRKEKVPLIKSRDRHLAGWELTSRIKQIAKQINRHEEKKKHIAPQRLAYSCCAAADFVSLETQGSQICTFPWKTILCKKRQERDKTKNGI